MKYIYLFLIGLLLIAGGFGIAKATDVRQFFGGVQWGKTTGSNVPEHGVFTYGGAVRPDPNGKWYILNNATHEPLGLASVTQTSEKVQVHLNNCYDEVSTAYAVADEGFASQKLRPGLMMGLCEFTFWIYDNDGNIVDPSTTYKSGNNIWVYSIGTD